MDYLHIKYGSTFLLRHIFWNIGWFCSILTILCSHRDLQTTHRQGLVIYRLLHEEETERGFLKQKRKKKGHWGQEGPSRVIRMRLRHCHHSFIVVFPSLFLVDRSKRPSGSTAQNKVNALGAGARVQEGIAERNRGRAVASGGPSRRRSGAQLLCRRSRPFYSAAEKQRPTAPIPPAKWCWNSPASSGCSSAAAKVGVRVRVRESLPLWRLCGQVACVFGVMMRSSQSELSGREGWIVRLDRSLQLRHVCGGLERFPAEKGHDNVVPIMGRTRHKNCCPQERLFLGFSLKMWRAWKAFPLLNFARTDRCLSSSLTLHKRGVDRGFWAPLAVCVAGLWPINACCGGISFLEGAAFATLGPWRGVMSAVHLLQGHMSVCAAAGVCECEWVSVRERDN